MGYMLALVFIVMASTFYFDATSGPIRDAQINGGILAQQLIVQQAAASRVCTTSEACPSGTVLTLAQLEAKLGSYDSFASSSHFADGDLVSFSTGAKVVSYFQTAGSSAYQTQTYGAMMAWLQRNSNKANIRYVGTYDGSGSMTSGGTVSYHLLNPDGTTTSVTCSFPAVTLSGAPSGIPKGSPMLATDLFSSSGSTSGNVSVCS